MIAQIFDAVKRKGENAVNDKEARAAFADMQPVVYRAHNTDEPRVYRYIDKIEYTRSGKRGVILQVGLNDLRRMDKRCAANSLIMTYAENIQLYDGAVDDAQKYTKKKEPPKKSKFGKYKNVLLTVDEVKKLQEKYPRHSETNEAWDYWVERVSEYVASTGKAYTDHYKTILNWAARHEEEQLKNLQKKADAVRKKSKFNNYTDSNKEDYSDFGEKIIDEMLKETEI